MNVFKALLSFLICSYNINVYLKKKEVDLATFLKKEVQKEKRG